ncbi:MAG: T9SS type A sorting domain-containing protein [Sphingobacteriales bacterium]|nr:MAG: T9SS type A sorting domain-containing protein [Sphingobacteriales bacterium]
MRPFFTMLKCIFVIVAMLPISTTAIAKTPESPASAKIALTENKGQVVDQFRKPRTDIDFKLSGGGVNIFIGDGQIHYQWYRNSKPGNTVTKEPGISSKDESLKRYQDGAEMNAYRLDMILVGANPNAEIIKEEKQSYFENYYLAQYTGTAFTFNKATYKDIYPNIDWVLYTTSGQLKYDFVVHPGGDPKQIKLKYEGATAMEMKGGAVVARTPLGNITEQKPYSYDAVTGKEIASSFTLDGHTLSFNIRSEVNHDLVIDPLLNWATYYGSTEDEMAEDVVTNSAGHIFMCGWTTSFTNMATTGVHQTTLNAVTSDIDAFIVKMTDANTRAWATYYGGGAQDWLYSAAIDPAGSLYFAGETKTYTGLASTGAHQLDNGGLFDVLVVKIDPTDGTRMWSTYIGGSGDDDGYVNCDAEGNVYLCGETWSNTGIATAGSHQPALSGGRDGYLIKLSQHGARIWGTYFGGTDHDAAQNVVFDTSNNVIICGATRSTSGIATSGSHQSTWGGGGWGDGFLAKFTNTGSLIWSTYYGGTAEDAFRDLASDTAGNIYVSGYASSTSNIASSGAYQSTLNGAYDAILVKFNGSGVRQWGTYYGGNIEEGGYGIALNTDGHIFLYGVSSSTTGLVPANGLHTTAAGNGDAFLAEFDNNGMLWWSTYFGGAGIENDWTMPVGNSGGGYRGTGGNININNGKLYFVGGTNSTSGIATPGAYQSVLNNNPPPYTSDPSNFDGYLTCWQVGDTLIGINEPFTDTIVCLGSTITLNYSITGQYGAGNVFTAQLSDTNGTFALPINLGSITSTNAGSILATIPDNIPPSSKYHIRIVSSLPWRSSSCGCATITVAAYPDLIASTDSIICAGPNATLQLKATTTFSGPLTYKWTGNGTYSFNSTLQNPVITPVEFQRTGTYIVAASNKGCTTYDTLEVLVRPNVVITSIGYNNPVCEDGVLMLNANALPAGATFSWSGPGGFTSSDQNPLVDTSATMPMAGIYKVTAALDGCISPVDSINVVVRPAPAVSITANPGLAVSPSQQVTFTATAAHVGIAPRYQWYKNGLILTGETNATLITDGLYFSDQISVDVVTEDSCAIQMTISDTVTIGHPTGLDNSNNPRAISLYPNPNKGSFKIAGITDNELYGEITNTVGRVVYRDQIKQTSGEINMDTRLPQGVYLLRLSNRDGFNQTVKFTITE